MLAAAAAAAAATAAAAERGADCAVEIGRGSSKCVLEKSKAQDMLADLLKGVCVCARACACVCVCVCACACACACANKGLRY